MSNRAPQISVLISCYNADKGDMWLRRALDSVFAQTCTDFEVVVINDGSSDATASILNDYGRRYSNVVVHHKKNTGLADSLNVGMRLAAGKWIARIDADDLAHPERLERQLAYVNSNPKVVFVGTGYLVIDRYGRTAAAKSFSDQRTKLVEDLLYGRGFPPHSSAFFLRAAALQTGGYRPAVRRAEDKDLWLRLSSLGGIGCIADALVSIRKHETNISLEGGGRRQAIDSTACSVAHALRMKGADDPLNGQDETVDRFLRFVERQLSTRGVFAREHHVAHLKTLLSDGSVRGRAHAAAVLAMNPLYSCGVLVDRLRGQKWIHRAADKWTTANG